MSHFPRDSVSKKPPHQGTTRKHPTDDTGRNFHSLQQLRHRHIAEDVDERIDSVSEQYGRITVRVEDLWGSRSGEPEDNDDHIRNDRQHQEGGDQQNRHEESRDERFYSAT